MQNRQTHTSPELLSYIAERQSDAMHLESLLTVIDFIDNEGKCQNEMTSLIMLATQMAADLNKRLDSVNLPEG